jgi:hypothetical protein
MSDQGTHSVTIRHAGDAAAEPDARAPAIALPSPDGKAAEPKIVQGVDATGRKWVLDAKSRRLTLRELDIMEEQEMIGIVGDPLCLNRLYMGRILTMARVAEIDGDRVDVPKTGRELIVMMKRVDRHGMNAVAEFEKTEDDSTVAQAKK